MELASNSRENLTLSRLVALVMAILMSAIACYSTVKCGKKTLSTSLYRGEKCAVSANTCHPPVTLVTLESRVQPLYTKGFCHPDTLKAKNPCMDALCACRLHGTLCLTLRLCARVKTKQDSALNL